MKQETRKEVKKKWNRPVIATSLPINKTLGQPLTMNADGGMAQTMWRS